MCDCNISIIIQLIKKNKKKTGKQVNKEKNLMNFTAIDFETAHANFPCEIGISVVENGRISFTKSWLIKPACFPYMNPFNQRVHGISSADVAKSKNFEELWSELRPYLDETILVAHNAAFDMNVLRTTLKYYDLAVPKSQYFCSVSLARKTWKNLSSHSLGSLCDFHQIQFHHHRAGDDAMACALITLKSFQIFNAITIEDGIKNS